MGFELFAHNQETFNNMLRLFENNRMVAAVQPTGTGKSLLFLKWTETHPNHEVLVCSPSNYISGQLRAYCEKADAELENLQSITYSKLLTMDETDMAETQADFIVLDEFHRCGAREWGRGVMTLLETHPKALVFGTSATPVRYLDNGRNMADELFQGVYAVNMSLSEAISKKLLPAPIYVGSYYRLEGELALLEMRAQQSNNEYLKATLNRKIEKAKRLLVEKQCGVHDIFKKHLTETGGHYLVFCSCQEHLEKAFDECDEWFDGLCDGIHKYRVHSGYGNSQTEFDEFTQDETPGCIKLLFCIDMLSEGIHPEALDGVIMLRATESLNVYYQQIGRALSCGRNKQKRPIIFDLVNNFDNRSAGALDTGLIYELRQECTGDDGLEPDFQIFDYLMDLRTALNDIYSVFANSWDYNFEIYKEFVQTFHRQPVNGDKLQGVLLADWCGIQRKQYKKGILSPQRAEKLEAMGICWDVQDENWNQTYLALSQFVEREGHLPGEKENSRLFAWLRYQKRLSQTGELSKDRAEKLTKLGVCLDMSIPDALWEQKLADYCAFLQENVTEPKRNGTEEEKKLAVWMTNQRKLLKKGGLSPERQERLEAIGGQLSSRFDRSFRENFTLLQAFVSEHDRLPKCSETYQGKNLGRWCSQIRNSYKEKALSTEQLRKLESVGFVFTAVGTQENEENWNAHYEDLVCFYSENGRFPYHTEDNNTYAWLRNQVSRAKNGKLSQEKVSRLSEIHAL